VGRSALDELEEGVHLLRRQPAGSWILYLLGAAPLSLAILAFARDMTSGYRADRCLAESLLCAAVFFWASFWKARFAGTLLTSMSELDARAELNGAWECAFVQGVLQGFKLLVLPFAVATVVPLPWVSALFRSVSTEANRPGATLSGTLRRSAEQASAQAVNWVGLLTCCVAALVVFANVFAMLILVPQFLKAFTGFENEWTRNAGRLVNGNTFAVAVAITWLALDPMLQAYSAVRSFYFQARSDGRDLVVGLRRITGASLLLALVASAGVSSAEPAPTITLSSADLGRSVERVVRKQEYNWLRRSKEVPVGDWFGARMVRDLDRATHLVGSWIRSFSNWIDKLFRHKAPDDKVKETGRPPAPKLQWLLYLLAGILAAGMVLLVLRTRRTVPQPIPADASSVTPVDLNKDDALASDRPEEHWLALARDYASKGELRLAIRAMYLSNLSYLGEQQLIAIAKSKSNAIYEKELRARCRAEGVRVAFSRSNRSYERAWYGMHEVTPELRDGFEQELLAVRGNA
jgi:hypothetical protein